MENPECPYCGEMMDENNSDRIRLHKVYWYTCDNCGATSPYAKSPEEALAAAMRRDRAKGSMSLYIYKKLGEWLGAPCNLSFSDFLARYCGDFCDDCNSEYEKCWKKFFETLEEMDGSNE